MRNLILVVVFLCCTLKAAAQFHVAINGTLLYPTANMGNMVDYGYGTSFSAGYIINHTIDISAGYGKTWLNSMLPENVQSSAFIDLRYLILKKGTIPYIGSRGAYIHSSTTLTPTATLTDQYFGLAPMVGALFGLGQGSKLKADTNLLYMNAFNDQKHAWFELGIGLRYHF